MRAVRKLLSVAFFVLTGIFSLITIMTFIDSVSTNSDTVIAIALALISLVLGFAFKPSKRANEAKADKTETGIIASSMLSHVEGLPLAEKTQCSVCVTTDGLMVDGGGTEFKISNSQIRAAEVKTDTEIAHIVNSSATKGIAGGLLFGPIGLVVGARATSKEKKTLTHFLIINYESSSGELAALMFDGGTTPFGVQKIVSKLRPVVLNNPAQTVHL